MIPAVENHVSSQGADVIEEGAASPQFLARRMRRIEDRLSGERRIVLTCEPSRIAEQLEKLDYVERVHVWPWPFEAQSLFSGANSPSRNAVMRQMRVFEKLKPGQVNPLWIGRLLQFQGKFASDDAAGGRPGAKSLLLNARTVLSEFVGKKIPAEYQQRFEVHCGAFQFALPSFCVGATEKAGLGKWSRRESS